MSDLEHFSQEPSTDKSDEIFKTSVKSYLQLIDKRKKREENEIALPGVNFINFLRAFFVQKCFA